jgi:hypothetical protein
LTLPRGWWKFVRVAEPDENEVLVMDMGMGEKKEKK